MTAALAEAAAAETQADWRANLAKIGAAEGFYEDLGAQHSALYVSRGRTLIVTFENLDHVYERGADRLPWGYDFVKSRGWSMLGLMAHDWTWYRDDAVLDFFDRLRDEGFFAGFDRVVFYGASMGGYAACAFSAAAPGATVVAISPQATLDRSLASWETRYVKAWRRDFTERYGFAPDCIETAARVHLFFDPAAQLDAMHASLFRSDNVDKYPCRYMGHRIASLWLQMGILKPVTEGCVDGTMTRAEFYRWMRARRDVPRYQKSLLQRVTDKDRADLTIRLCTHILSQRRAPAFRQALKRAEKKAGRG